MANLKVDSNTVLEAGLRIRSTRANWRQAKGLMTSLGQTEQVEKTAWARTDSHPSGAQMWKVGRDLGDDGYVEIPEALQDKFDAFEGFAMLKVATRLDRRHFAVPMRYHDRELYGLDRTLPNGRRQDGTAVYSIPFHGLVPTDAKEGRKYAFFFLVTVTGDDDHFVNIAVEKVTITRGKDHFRVLVDPYWKTERPVPVERLSLADTIEDLPIALAVEEYGYNYRQLPETDPAALRNMERSEAAANHATNFSAALNGDPK